MEKPNKGKIILFSAIGGCSLLIIILVIYLFSSGKSNNSEDSKPPILSSKDNLTVKDMIDINGENKNEYGEKKDTIIDNTAKYNQQIEGIYGIGKAPEPQKTEPPRVAKSPTNSHDVYGNYDMWTSKEPSNSKIGYNSKRNVQPTVQSNPVKQQSYEVIEPSNNMYSNVVQNDNKVQPKILLQLQASLLSKGFATNGRSLSFVLLEAFSYKGESVKKGQILVGTANVDDSRIFVKFTNGKFNGKTFTFNGNVTGVDGGEGLPLSKIENSKGTGENVKNEVLSQSSGIPVVGGVIRTVQNVTRNNSGYSNSNKVYLSENTKCIINIYE